MPLQNYSLLVGTPVDYLKQEFAPAKSLHFEIKVSVNNSFYRIAVDVWSVLSPHPLKYAVIEDFKNPITTQLSGKSAGLYALESSASNPIALDYLRRDLFNMQDLKTAPQLAPDNENPLSDIVQEYTQKAANSKGLVYAFGDAWRPQDMEDLYFHFTPDQGIHDIHMNQGNRGKFANDNGVYQDGGLMFYYPETKTWTAIFLLFQSQILQTDDQTGDLIAQN